jgi:hypothetical protein
MANPIFTAVNVTAYNYNYKQRPYNYNITLENKDYPADLLLIVNKRDRFKVSSRLLCENCDYFASKSLQDELEISLPFDSLMYEFLFFLTYEDVSVLAESVKYFHELIELYILMSTLQYHHTDMYDIINSVNLRMGINPINQRMPKIWHRDYVDFDFVVSRVERVGSMSSSMFGTVSADYKMDILAYFFTWLGFDSIKNTQELKDLQQSQEFKKVKEYIEVHNIYPNNQQSLSVILSRFPRASGCLSSTILLERLRLI